MEPVPAKFWQELGLNDYIIFQRIVLGLIFLTIRRKFMCSQFPPNLSRLQNNPPENNVEPVPPKSELPPKQSAGK
jgi:hypothetical protein